MKIGIDASRAFGSQRTGTENYSLKIIEELIRNFPDDDFILYTRESSGRSWPVNAHEKRLVFPRLWTQVGLAIKTYTDRLDLLFIPSHTMPILGNRKLKYVVTIHDLGVQFLPQFDKFPHKYYLDFTTKYAIKHADGLVAVSQTTRKDILNYFPEAAAKTRVVYEGYDETIFNEKISKKTVNAIKKKFELKDYILFVGTIQPRKNLSRLIEAYAGILKDLDKTDLVIVGKRGWNYEEIIRMPKKLGIKNRVRFLGYIPDEYLPGLYKGARMTVLPSLYEGFGLPVLESMAVGTPVVVAKGSSLTEVVEKSGLLVNPKSVEDISEKIAQLASKKSLHKRYSKLALKRAGFFAWSTAAIKTRKFFDQVAGVYKL